MPLLGSYGGSSEYAYRGTIDDFPDDFSFINQTNVIPGQLSTSNQVTITGINNKALVRVSAGASVSINGGSYVIPTEASPVFIKNNETLSVRIPSTSGQVSDFNKVYAVEVGVGRKIAPWQVSTKIIDVDPTPFTFTNLTNREIGIGYTSNEITISGLEAGFPFPAEIISGDGQIIKNGAPGVPLVNVLNGDKIYLNLISPFEYSEFPTGSGVKTNSTTIRVGSYSTSWSVSSRNVDVFVDPFDFNDVNNALVDSVYTAESVNTLGFVTTITGADQGIPLIGAVSGCELKVDKPAAGGGFTIRRDFSTQNTTVFNGDKLTVRITTGPNFSETKVGIVTVSTFAGRFIVTTRPRPIDTIPDRFDFVDLDNQSRNVVVESNEITLVGMTTFTDEADASISTGTNGGNAQFQVTRNGSIIRSFSSSPIKVRNGDKIKLRITTSPESNINRTATFRVDGIDTFTVISGTNRFVDDVWNVTSAIRNCDITPFTLQSPPPTNPSTVLTTNFLVTGFESDCNMRVSTSNPNSFLSAAGQSGSTISVSPGTLVTLSMTSGAFSEVRTTTVTVSNSGTTPTRSYSTDWTITTLGDSTPASVILTAEPTTVELGQPVTLTWSSINAALVTGSNGFNVGAFQLSGSTTVVPTQAGTQNFSISVQPKPSAINFPTIQSDDASVNVNQSTIPNDFTLSPQNYINQTPSTNVTFEVLFGGSSSVSGLGNNVTVPASVSSFGTYELLVNGTVRVSNSSTAPFSVRNGDVLTLRLRNSTLSNDTVTAVLSVGNKSQTCSTTTLSCTVTEPTLTISGPGNIQVTGKTAKYTNLSGSVVGSESGNLALYKSKSGALTTTFAKPGTSPTTSTTTTPGTPTQTIQKITLTGSMTASSACSVTATGDATITAITCTVGGESVQTCSKETSNRHYRVVFNNGVQLGGNVTVSITTFSTKTTATGKDVTDNITLAGTTLSPSAIQATEFRVWFCRSATNNTGSTFIKSFSWSATGNVPTTTPGTPTNTPVTTPGTPGVTYDSLITRIVTRFNNQGSRPPSLDEIKQFSDIFVNSNIALSQLDTQITNYLTNNLRAQVGSVRNNCGGTF